jgi:hypothetical protein
VIGFAVNGIDKEKDVNTDNQGLQSEPQTGKHGVLRAYALIILLEVALIALLWAVHVPWGVLNALILLACIVLLIGKQLTGPTEHVQISSPAFEHRIQDRYRSESNQLSNLGFTPLFFYGEAFPLFRLLLIYPAILFLIMWLNREVITVLDGSKLLFGYPVFISNNRTTYAHPSQLGMKYHTAFQDGTILMTKNFGGKTKYGPRVVVHIMNNASIRDTWTEHLKQVQALEAVNKQINCQISFQAFSDISYEA